MNKTFLVYLISKLLIFAFEPILQRGRVNVPLFKTIKTYAGVKAVSFGMAVAFMKFIKELRRNGRKPPSAADFF